MRIHPIANLVPEMSAEDYARLRDDIACNGLRESIWTYEGKVLDGRHRLKACNETGKKPKFREYRGKAPKQFVWALNGARRHLSKSQLAAIAVELVEEIEANEGKARKAAAGRKGKRSGLPKRPNKKSPNGDKLNGKQGNVRAPKSSDKAAKQTGASGRQTQRAKRVKEADPNLLRDVKAGKVTLSQAEREVKRREKVKDQNAKAAAAKKKHGASPECKVICGDCVEQLNKLSNVRTIFADPPYNIGINYGTGKKADSMEDDAYLSWCDEWITACANALADDGSLWVMINDEWAEHFAAILNGTGLHRRAWIKWYETFGVNCSNNFNRTSRHIFYYVVNPRQFVFHADKVQQDTKRATVYSDKRADPSGTKILDDVWSVPRLTDNHPERQPDYPTQVPEQITDWIVGCSTDPGDLVVDPFTGTGTTGASCRKFGRRFIGIEQNQDYADRAQVRIIGTEVLL